jgi:hypothetical protein
MSAFSGVGADAVAPGAPADTYMASVRVLPGDPARAGEATWVTACYRLTMRVERISSARALLDLGRCTPEEALDAIRVLLGWLGDLAPSVRVGVAPSLSVAQLAMFQTSVTRPIWLVTPAEVPVFLRPLPVAVISELHPQGIITAETLRRLQQYGLRTLGQVARLGTSTLRRHFGAAVGDTFAAVTTGRDPRLLVPTPPPATLSLRLRLPEGALPPAEVPSLVPLLAAQAATLLHQGRVQAQRLRLLVRWDTGQVQEATTVLHQPTSSIAPLTSAVRDLMERLLSTQPTTPAETRQGPSAPAIAGLRLTLGELHLQAPEQGAFWRTRAQRLAALATVSETLAVRYGRAVLVRPRLAVPDAIFQEDRYRLAADAEGDVTAGENEAASTSRPSADEMPGQHMPQPHWW